jgi:hypothetical protein
MGACRVRALPLLGARAHSGGKTDGVSFHLAAGERCLGVVGARMADGRVKRDEAEMTRLREEFVALQREATEIKRELGIG